MRTHTPAPWTPRMSDDSPKELLDLLSHDILIVTPLLNGPRYELDVHVKSGQVMGKCPKDLHEALRPIDFRNLPREGKWKIRCTLMGPEINGNDLELVKPAIFISAICNERLEWLEAKELFSVCDGIGVDTDVAFVRIESKLMSRETLQLLAEQVTLPNGKHSGGILVRPEQAPWLAIQFKSTKKGDTSNVQEDTGSV